MKNSLPTSLVAFILSYILLAAYFNLLPLVVPMSDVLRVLHMILFFPVAYGVARVIGHEGLGAYGVVRFPGWRRNFILGFLTGCMAWAVLFLLYFILHKYEYIGLHINKGTAMLLASILFGYGVGSFISDMIVRGFVYSHFKDKLHPKAVFAFAVILYALDDVWYAGFSLQNTIFSIALGLGLTYIYSKTSSIWASAGIHFGLNTVYGLFFGVSGESGDGVVAFTVNPAATFLSTWLSTIIALLMFAVIYLMRRHYHGREEHKAGHDEQKLDGGKMRILG